ncbi:MAG: NeuD/PglB/VioB family sugar acetyltransferase [Anaerolineaceae bacterium]|nr:NeuD/PglB/VioB family sugar acetyltransferase [Anaerolineaceae bacterium]
MVNPFERFYLPDLSFGPTDLLIYGGGGHGKVIIDLVRALNCYKVIGIIDDRLQAGSQVLGLPVLGGADILPEMRQRGVSLAINAVGGIGNVDIRLKVFDSLTQAGYSCPTVVHPTAFIEPSASLDLGVQVLSQSYISSDAKVGFGTVINAGVVVSHDCVIGKCVNLSPGAMLAGAVRVEDFAQIGMAATINLDLTIGARARVGNGATVKADVPSNGIVRAGTIWPVPCDALRQ